jgi:hypothetical protein
VFKSKKSTLKLSPPNMILEGLDYIIEKAFGRFLIVQKKRGKVKWLIELGSSDYSKVVSTLSLSHNSDQQV